MVIIIIIVLLIIMGLGIALYKVLKDETEIIAEDKQKEKEIMEKNKKVNYAELIFKNGLESVYESIKDKPDEIEKMKVHIQIELRNATKEKNTAKIRECNDILRRIDQGL